MIPILLGVHRLQQWALKEGAAATVVDTSGFIEPDLGAAILKWAKVDLLKPSILVSLQRETELEPVLAPLRPLFGSRLHELPVSHAARERLPDERKAHRSNAYRAYFRDAQLISLSLLRKAIFPERVASPPNFTPGQLVAMEDDSGFALALGVVERFDPGQHALWLHTPWWGQGKITTIRMGGIRLNLDSFHDEVI